MTRSDIDRTPIVMDTFHDEEAGVWVATARDGLGVVTEADTLDALRTRLAVLLRDFLEVDAPVPFVLVERPAP